MSKERLSDEELKQLLKLLRYSRGYKLQQMHISVNALEMMLDEIEEARKWHIPKGKI